MKKAVTMGRRRRLKNPPRRKLPIKNRLAQAMLLEALHLMPVKLVRLDKLPVSKKQFVKSPVCRVGDVIYN
jgi:hypothetical protein